MAPQPLYHHHQLLHSDDHQRQTRVQGRKLALLKEIGIAMIFPYSCHPDMGLMLLKAPQLPPFPRTGTMGRAGYCSFLMRVKTAPHSQDPPLITSASIAAAIAATSTISTLGAEMTRLLPTISIKKRVVVT